MKNIKTKLVGILLLATMLFGLVAMTGCAPTLLTGTSLAEALLADERINREHLETSFDFLDDRLGEESVALADIFRFMSYEGVRAKSATGEIISGSGDTAVYSWSKFEKLVTELYYFKSHFSAGQTNTDSVNGNISFLEEHTDIKDKWVSSISFIDYLMQVEENREIVYAKDTHNGSHEVGIRTVNGEADTTYESYRIDSDGTIVRTLSTPGRRYEVTTIVDDDVMAFIADNDNGYWRFVQFQSQNGGSSSLNVLIMTDELAYSFRYVIDEGRIYSYDETLISPDLKYEIASINGPEITLFPSSLTGINELRVSMAEQLALGELGKIVGHDKEGHYSSNAAPDIHTDKGVIKAPVPYYVESGGTSMRETVIDDSVTYSGGNVKNLWEPFVYPELTFRVAGETISEQFDNLHTALSAWGIEPIYNKSTVGAMAENMMKLVEGFTSHYSVNGEVLSSYEAAVAAYEKERAKSDKYEQLYLAALELPTASDSELIEASQNAAFPAISLGGNATVSVENGRVSISGLAAVMNADDVLELDKSYVLKLALKKNTNVLEELIVLGNLASDRNVSYQGSALALTLDGQFDLPTDVAEGSYDLVAYAATTDEGIRVSKFQRVLAAGEINDEVTLDSLKIYTSITDESFVRSVYTGRYDLYISMNAESDPAAFTVDDVMEKIESEILDKGYFKLGAALELYDVASGTGTALGDGEIIAGNTYRLEYLARADGGERSAYVYCEVRIVPAD